jgi:hypothetical protein
MDCYRTLAGSIIAQAAADLSNAYRAGLDNGRARLVVANCESFFRGDWFQMLCDGAVDGERAIEAIKSQAARSTRRPRKLIDPTFYTKGDLKWLGGEPDEMD